MELTLQVDPDIAIYLERIVQEYGHNPEYWLMELARNSREDLEDALLADKAMQEMKANGEKGISSEEIKGKYGIQD